MNDRRCGYHYARTRDLKAKVLGETQSSEARVKVSVSAAAHMTSVSWMKQETKPLG